MTEPGKRELVSWCEFQCFIYVTEPGKMDLVPWCEYQCLLLDDWTWEVGHGSVVRIPMFVSRWLNLGSWTWFRGANTNVCFLMTEPGKLDLVPWYEYQCLYLGDCTWEDGLGSVVRIPMFVSRWLLTTTLVCPSPSTSTPHSPSMEVNTGYNPNLNSVPKYCVSEYCISVENWEIGGT